MAFELPIVATIAEGGVTFRVRAVPFGLARKFSAGGGESIATLAEVYERCVEAVDGDDRPAGVTVDDLPAELVGRLARAACEGAAGNPA